MSRWQPMIDRFRQLPRAAQWALAAVAATVLFLLWNDHIMRFTDDWNRKADQLLANLSEAAGGEQRLKNLRALQDSVRAAGTVEMPGEESDAENALNDVVNDVLKGYAVSRDSFSYRGPAKLPRGTLSRVIAPGQQVERITGDLRFDASPEDALAIIAELESNPHVEAISNVRITRQSGPRKVTVDLTVDAWIVSAERRSRIGGA